MSIIQIYKDCLTRKIIFTGSRDQIRSRDIGKFIKRDDNDDYVNDLDIHRVRLSDKKDHLYWQS